MLEPQKTIENIIGGLTLLAERRVQVGERCCFGDKEGYVE
ncbi:MAG: mechanosensitive ion channel domain-containing protein [Xenococcaceae cyanobacterium]